MISDIYNDFLFVGVNVRIDGLDIFISEDFRACAVEPEEFAIRAVAVAMTFRAFIPTIFGEAIVLADLVNPHNLSVIQTWREVIEDVILSMISFFIAYWLP